MGETRQGIYVAWHRRLEARVLVAGVTVSAFCLAAVLIAAVELVSSYGIRTADEQIASAKASFDQLLLNRSSFVRTQLRLVTELPIFLALLNSSEIRADKPTMDAMAEHYRDELRAEACVISDVLGNQLGKATLGSTNKLPHDLRNVGIDPSKLSIIPLEGKLFLIVSQPAVFAEEQLGLMTAAYPIDDELALELARMTRTEVSFLAAGTVVSSSLGSTVRPHVQRMLGDAQAESFLTAGPTRIGPGQYVAGIYPLPGSGEIKPGSLLLMHNWQPTAQLISSLRNTLSWIAVATLGLAILGMVIFSRRVAGHMGNLALAARDIAAGNWRRRVPVAGSAEAILVAEAFNDMTDSLVHWHEEAATRLGRLQAAYERFSAVTDSASDAIVSIDQRGAITLWNPGAQRLFGYTEPEMNGVLFQDLVGPEGRNAYRESVDRLANPNHEVENGVACEIEATARDGHKLIVDLSLAPLRTGEDGLIAVMRDATVRIETERLLQAARQAAEIASRNKSAFVANMSHELRTPLNAIIGYSEMLHEEAKEQDSPQVEDLGKVIAAARQLLAIINDILDFSKIEAGRMTLSIGPFIIGDLVRDVVSTATPLIEKSGNRFEVIGSDLGEFVADRLRVQQVLLNLLSNAAKFTQNGTVRLCSRQEGETVIFEVQDTGVGIAKENIGLLFRDFSQVDASSSRRFAGTGLGLAISRQICRMMGGDLTVESVLGQGSTFTARIPACLTAEEQDIEAAMA